MIVTQGRAQQIAVAFHQAVARRDMRGALELVDDEVVCDGVEGILPFADRLSAQFDVLERSDLIAAFGDDTTAVLLHHDQTIPAPDVFVATRVTVADGRITQMHVRPADRQPRDAACRPGRRPG